MTQRKVLGRGLESLMSSEVLPFPETHQRPTHVPIERIFANRRQPRTTFADEALQNLADSILKEGILQPLIVKSVSEGRYELIAGERRLRAAKLAGLAEVPVIVRNVEEQKMLELALMENIQREDLNPMEEARGYQVLNEQFGLDQADIAERVGKSRESVTNALRLLKLPLAIQEDVAQDRMSSSHARALLALPSKEEMLFFREKILRETLSVRDVEQLVQVRSLRPRKMHANLKKHLSPQMKLLIDELEKVLATKVHFKMKAKEGQGQVVIDFYSWQDLDRVYKKIIS